MHKWQDWDADPEMSDEDDPEFQEELFRISRFLGCRPEEMLDKDFATKYAEWLKVPPEE